MTETAGPDSRGLWVWQSVPARVIVDFARRRGVNRLWLATSSLGWSERRRLAATIRRGARHGISAAALGGAPAWAFRHGEAMAWARRSSEMVGSLHVDVEPYALRAWDTERDRLVRGYLELLERLRTLPARLEVDVPFWYGSIPVPGGGNLADAVLARVDAVTVMSYRDYALGVNGIIDISRDWLRRSTQAHIPVTLGAETNPLPDCEHCSFAEEGAAALDREQAVVLRHLHGRPSFDGVAVHDWAGWKALLER